MYDNIAGIVKLHQQELEATKIHHQHIIGCQERKEK